MKRHDNMRRGPVSFTLSPLAFQRTDGPVKGPAPFPVQPDCMIITSTPFATSAVKPTRVGPDEISHSLCERDEPYGEPY